MDVAYDNVQKQAYPDDEPENKTESAASSSQPSDLNTEVQQAYRAISSSPWAARLGGFLGSVKKQGEQYYQSAQQEYSKASEQANTGLSSIISETKGLSVQDETEAAPSEGTSKGKEPVKEVVSERPESLSADILKEAGGLFSLFRAQASSRLKEIQKAEDAADEALLKFGTNITSFLREAVTVAPPEASENAGDSSKVLFESKDAEGRRVIHTTRFDAQLHVIHSSLDSFMKDPVSPEWKPWGDKFDIKAHTDTISTDLEKYEELRRAMEKVVPEKVEYADFWKRYYFLRHVIESEEKRRKELLKASASNATDEEVAWDEDSEEEDESSTPSTNQPLAASVGTLKPKENKSDLLRPEEPRKSSDQQSRADSDASYDVVSGATSRAQGSPKEAKKEPAAEESDEDDWE